MLACGNDENMDQAEKIMGLVALVVAAGRGVRAGGALPKQYQPLLGLPLLRRSLNALLACPEITAIAVVINEADRALYEKATAGLELLPPVNGGATRQESVRLGLLSLENMGFDAVLIHDAARPFLSLRLLARIVENMAADAGIIPALAVADSLKRVKSGRQGEAVTREDLYRLQTPQAFPFKPILAAHRKYAGKALTDDSAVAEAAGMEVRIVAGEEDNFKVTEAGDLGRAERYILMTRGDIRTGQGIDVHKFGPGDHLTLCGVKIPHSQGLIGHSDADVGLHALTDAILGAVGAADIGQHFPPGDPKWKGASSDRFLSHAAALVAALGGIIAHVDVTIICEAPKVSPHRAAMIARIAEILELAPARVSVKATTTEGLGFTGRREGIAAEATATVRLPTGESE
jgi:2-C-methyl-D-erythritol 4-phosphate cytidylyltransferase/2-C-methyl-D-erythritol 2,4-cyclodiphosphate synthase